MRDGEVWFLLGLGALVVASPGLDFGDPALWAFPIPDLVIKGVAFPAEVSQEFRGVGVLHQGVDLMYRRRSGFDTLALPYQGHNGNLRWFEPPGTPVLSARAGTVWSVDRSPRGIEIVVDHGAPWATYYQHVENPKVQKGDVVKAGDAIATAGWDPTDPEGLRHLHFAVWYKGSGNNASVDPQRAMAAWRRTSWTLGAA
jgi:murein DD-endopeptidase MepM/ murein hydrolase activator NlpD